MNGDNVLIHCVAGVSRSASFIIAYLIRYGHMDLVRAYDHVKKRRPKIRPNQGFMTQLMDWEWAILGEEIICGGVVGGGLGDESILRLGTGDKKVTRTL
jgi:hypothetical protein